MDFGWILRVWNDLEHELIVDSYIKCGVFSLNDVHSVLRKILLLEHDAELPVDDVVHLEEGEDNIMDGFDGEDDDSDVEGDSENEEGDDLVDEACDDSEDEAGDDSEDEAADDVEDTI